MPTTAKNRATAHPSTRFITIPFHNRPTERKRHWASCRKPLHLALVASRVRRASMSAARRPVLPRLPACQSRSCMSRVPLKQVTCRTSLRLCGLGQLCRFARAGKRSAYERRCRRFRRSCDKARLLCRFVALGQSMNWRLCCAGSQRLASAHSAGSQLIRSAAFRGLSVSEAHNPAGGIQFRFRGCCVCKRKLRNASKRKEKPPPACDESQRRCRR